MRKSIYAVLSALCLMLQPEEYGDVRNSEPGAMLAQSAKDFEHAISTKALPEKASLGDKTNLAHCTLAAAQGYLGKIYLFQKRYKDAAAMLENIISSCKYALYEGDYADIIKAPSNWSDEGIFEINCPPGQTDATAPQLMSYVYLYAGWREDFFDFTNLASSSRPISTPRAMVSSILPASSPKL